MFYDVSYSNVILSSTKIHSLTELEKDWNFGTFSKLLPTLRNLVERARIENLTYAWVEALVDRLKASGRAPSTILKRVSGLARVVDWAMRRKLVNFETNPFRLIPRGYCSHQIDRNKVWEGERDRRLEPGEEEEEEAIRKVLQPHEALLFDMALETAMRLSEMLILRWSDINLSQRTIFLNRTEIALAVRFLSAPCC